MPGVDAPIPAADAIAVQGIAIVPVMVTDETGVGFRAFRVFRS